MTKSSMALAETTTPSMTVHLLTQQHLPPHHTPWVHRLTLQQQQTHPRPIHMVMDKRVEFQVQGTIVL